MKTGRLAAVIGGAVLSVFLIAAVIASATGKGFNPFALFAGRQQQEGTLPMVSPEAGTTNAPGGSNWVVVEDTTVTTPAAASSETPAATTVPKTSTAARTRAASTTARATSSAAATETRETEPPTTESTPAPTDPPVTDPPATEPPATEPPTTEPPATEPPATEPPATEVVEVPDSLLVHLNAASMDPSELTGSQLLVVKGLETPLCVVYAFEKVGGRWQPLESLTAIPGIMGADGMALHTPENAKFTPIGYFGLGPAYGEAASEDTGMEYHQIERGDYFVIDKDSRYYNQLWKAGRDELDWQYAEEMIEMLQYYALCIYIQKNVNPVVYNEGSALFVHIDRLDNSTSGCIGVERWVMEALFRWMRADANPHILLYPGN